MKKFSLIVPIAAKYDSNQDTPPGVFQMCEKSLFCIDSILSIKNRGSFSAIYFTTLKAYSDKWNLNETFQKEFKKVGLKNTKLIELKGSTSSEPETIYRTIKENDISGSIFIKDADCSFSCNVVPYNSVAAYPLEKLSWVNPQHKSYICVDDNFYITNIIEKKIISNFFSAGGYCFESSEDFCNTFENIRTKKGLYLSHIVYSMLLDGKLFRPIEVENYIDFETMWIKK